MIVFSSPSDLSSVSLSNLRISRILAELPSWASACKARGRQVSQCLLLCLSDELEEVSLSRRQRWCRVIAWQGEEAHSIWHIWHERATPSFSKAAMRSSGSAPASEVLLSLTGVESMPSMSFL